MDDKVKKNEIEDEYVDVDVADDVATEDVIEDTKSESAENEAADDDDDDDDDDVISPEELKAIVKSETAAAEAEKRAMPSPETARLTYSAYADMKPCRESVYSPIGVFNYIGILLLTGIPAVGFIIAVIYAFASKKLARRRIATAIVVLQAILFALIGAAVAVAIFVFDVDILATLNAFISNFKI